MGGIIWFYGVLRVQRFSRCSFHGFNGFYARFASRSLTAVAFVDQGGVRRPGRRSLTRAAFAGHGGVREPRTSLQNPVEPVEPRRTSTLRTPGTLSTP